MANLKTSRTQHSVWLMLGGAMLVSVFGWAGIVRQTEGTAHIDAQPIELTIVELPVPLSAERGVAAQAPVTTSRVANSPPLRRVTRPVINTRSSN